MFNLSLISLFSRITQTNTTQVKLTDEQLAEIIKSNKGINPKEIQEIVNSIFIKAARIVNTEDSIYYLNSREKKQLEEFIEQIFSFKKFFVEKNDETKRFYLNIFAILMRTNCSKIIEWFDEIPEHLKQDEEIMNIYGMSLFENKRNNEALNIFSKNYENNKSEFAFMQKLLVLLEEKKYSEIYEITRKLRKNEYDKYGYIASYYLISKSEIQKEKIKEADIKKLNSKFKDMPLFYSTAASIIGKKINSGSATIKEYVQKGIHLLENCENNIVVATEFVNQCYGLRLESMLVKYLRKINKTSVHLNLLQLRILEYIEKKTPEEIQILEELVDFVEKYEIERIDINKAKAQLALEKHKELEAIKFLCNSFNNNENEKTASICLNLILKNQDINENTVKLIECLKKSNDSELVMQAAYGLKFINNKQEAKRVAIDAIYMLENRHDFNMYKSFLGIFSLEDKEEKIVLKTVINDCAVSLEGQGINQTIIIDSGLLECKRIFDTIAYPSNSMDAIQFIDRDIGEKIIYKDKEWRISNVMTKEDFFKNNIWKKVLLVETEKKTIKTFNVNKCAEDPLKEIKEFMIEDNKRMQQEFDAYDIEKNIDKPIRSLPLSFFCREEKNFLDIISFLLYDQETKFYAGLINQVELNSNKFVIDLTSLIFLGLLDKLNWLYPYAKDLYFTKSLKNKITYIFNKVLEESEDGISIAINQNQELCKIQKTRDNKKNLVNFWRKIVEFVNKCNIEEYESTLDSKDFDKSQFDMFSMAIEKEMVYVCDDLMIRHLVDYFSEGKCYTTNVSALLSEYCLEYSIEYLKIIEKLSDFKYIYCLDCYILYLLTITVLRNGNAEEYLEIYRKIIQNILQTKFLYEQYIGIIKFFLEETMNVFKITENSKKLFSLIYDEVVKYSIQYGKKVKIRNLRFQ